MPYAAAHEAIRQKRQDLTVVRMTPDVIYDQMIGMGCVSKMVFPTPKPGRRPVAAAPIHLRTAGRIGSRSSSIRMPRWRMRMRPVQTAFAVLRGYVGADLPKVNPEIREITCPFTGEVLAAVPAINPDVTFIHALKADRKGNILIEGIVGVQKEAVLAARRAVVTVEEVVDGFDAHPNALVLPHWTVDAVIHVPGGRIRPTRTGIIPATTRPISNGTGSPLIATSFLPGWRKTFLLSMKACSPTGRHGALRNDQRCDGR